MQTRLFKQRRWSKRPLWALWISGHLLALIGIPGASLALGGEPHPSHGLLVLGDFSLILLGSGGILLLVAEIRAACMVYQAQYLGWFRAFLLSFILFPGVSTYVVMWCYLFKGPEPAPIVPGSLDPDEYKEFWRRLIKACELVVSQLRKL